jgi:hypothetical protein
MRKTKSLNDLYTVTKPVEYTPEIIDIFEKNNKSNWLMSEEHPPEYLFQKLIPLISKKDTCDSVSLSVLQRRCLPELEDIDRLINHCNNFLESYKITKKILDYNFTNFNENYNYYYHRINVYKQMKTFFDLENKSNFSCTIKYSYHEKMLNDIEELMDNFLPWKMLCSDIKLNILGKLHTPIQVVFWHACMIKCQPLITNTKEQLFFNYKSYENNVTEKGDGPSAVSDIRGNTLIICSQTKIKRICKKINEYDISYSVLDNSFQILYTPAIQRDVVISPPHKIGALRNTFFNRIIVCVEKHPFYVNALPASNFKWVCRKLTLQPSEKECKFIGCSINKLKKRIIIVNSDRTV